MSMPCHLFSTVYHCFFNKGKQTKKKEEENAVWRWWEEKTHDDGNKWAFLEHKGPIFAPPYEPLPKDIKFYYDGG